jgi:hypothetical protein
LLGVAFLDCLFPSRSEEIVQRPEPIVLAGRLNHFQPADSQFVVIQCHLYHRIVVDAEFAPELDPDRDLPAPSGANDARLLSLGYHVQLLVMP